MSSSEVEADTGEVRNHLTGYVSSLQMGAVDGALSEAEALTKMDCSLCESFGNHLYALGVAAKTAPREETADKLVSEAISVAEYLQAVVEE